MTVPNATGPTIEFKQNDKIHLRRIRNTRKTYVCLNCRPTASAIRSRDGDAANSNVKKDNLALVVCKLASVRPVNYSTCSPEPIHFIALVREETFRSARLTKI